MYHIYSSVYFLSVNTNMKNKDSGLTFCFFILGWRLFGPMGAHEGPAHDGLAHDGLAHEGPTR